jgi:hypothetical protein
LLVGVVVVVSAWLFACAVLAGLPALLCLGVAPKLTQQQNQHTTTTNKPIAKKTEVIGSAIAILLLTRGAVPLWAGILLSAAASFTLLLVERFGVRLLEAVFAALIATMVGSFLRMYVAAAVPTGEVVRGFLVPIVPRENVGQARALMAAMRAGGRRGGLLFCAVSPCCFFSLNRSNSKPNPKNTPTPNAKKT